MRARGLKLADHHSTPAKSASRPVRARGLKPYHRAPWPAPCWSRPVRARGLKHHYRIAIMQSRLVAPRAGAWIETPTHRQSVER